MQLQVETQIYKKDAIKDGIDVAATQATNYITYVNESVGIQVHNKTRINKDFIQINATDISMWRNGKRKVELGDTYLTFYDGNGTADTNKLAQFGGDIKIYKPGTGLAVINIDSNGATIDGSVTIGGSNSTLSTIQSNATTALSDSIEYIIGTHGSTATNAWTGTTRDTSLIAGKTIAFYMTSAGIDTAATLNLTLANGQTTGPINVKINNSNVTTHFPQYTVINLTYDGTAWKCDNYNSDTYNRTRWQNVITASTAITSGRIICGTASGYKNIAANITFDISYPLLYAGSAIAAAATGDNNYLEINTVNVSSNGTISSGAANKVLYLKGTLSGNIFTISASPFLTTVVPTSQDNLCYIPMGVMYSSTHMYFKSSDQIYAYKDGAFGPISLREASGAAKTATSYITHIDNSGIFISPYNQSPSNNAKGNSIKIDGTGMYIYKGGTEQAHFTGAEAAIGTDGQNQVIINSNGLRVYKYINSQQKDVALFGETARIGIENSSHFIVGSQQLQAFDSIGARYFEVNDDGIFFKSSTTTTDESLRNIDEFINELANDIEALDNFTGRQNSSLSNSLIYKINTNANQITSINSKLSDYTSIKSLVTTHLGSGKALYWNGGTTLVLKSSNCSIETNTNTMTFKYGSSTAASINSDAKVSINNAIINTSEQIGTQFKWVVGTNKLSLMRI